LDFKRRFEITRNSEAILVVEQLKNILSENKLNGLHCSVGIVTFNILQKKEINNEIDRRRQKDPEFDDLISLADSDERNKLEDLLFVRNIESVQGEERDIIIFSTGYAKDLEDPDEKIGVQFGSLNRRDGEKYLNVAITRARREIIIICSFDPYRIKVEDTLHSGPRRLRDYLCYAKTISESRRQETNDILLSLPSGNSSRSSPKSEPEEHMQVLVRDELQKLGYEADLQVGHSNYKIDIAVIHPDNPQKYILAIELDGKSFLSSESTKERDITRQEFLENNGWTLERIWSRNWWRDSKREISRIHQRIQELRAIDKIDDVNTNRTPVISHTEQVDIQSGPEQRLKELIKKGESNTLEFKSSLIWDYKLYKPNKSLWHPTLKTVAAFMNSSGGLLVVGIADDGGILGLDKDFEVLGKKKSWDEWVQHFINMFNENIGKEFISFVKVNSIQYDEKTLAVIEVKRNDLVPIYLDPKGKSEFYIRSGTTTQLLNTKETIAYIKQHRYLSS
jgi:very-short-patch-repair endonuclease